jgi:ATP-dependent exoDNAse (exonuclease V) beta subunit
LDLIPVRYSPNLADTVFSEEYLQERFRIHVDNLNLLYVALTRAQDQLFIMLPSEPDKYDKLVRVSDLVGLALSREQPDNELYLHFDQRSLIWKLGEAESRRQTGKKEPSTEFIRETVSNTLSRTSLRTRWHGTDFLESGAERGINKGKYIHEILQSMDVADDLDHSVDRLFREGKLNRSEAAEIRNEIRDFLNLESVKDWFSGSWKVLKERDIITPAGELRRPDRVMMNGSKIILIDYKTGVSKRKAHETQMREYLHLVEEMGCLEPTGWICYIMLKEIIQIQS